MAMTIIAATFASAIIDADGRPSVNPHSGGEPGHYWHIRDLTITWPTHSIDIVNNVTQGMPGWDPSWAPGRLIGSEVIKSDATDCNPNNNNACPNTGILGHIHNGCSSTVYVQTAIGANCNNCGGYSDPAYTDTYAIAPGTTHTTTIRANINGGGGISVKLGKNAVIDPDNVYEIEYSEAANGNGNMAINYDLSSIKGNPFWDVARFMQIGNGNGCATIYNAPGSNAVDWTKLDGAASNQHECENVGDVYFYLC